MSQTINLPLKVNSTLSIKGNIKDSSVTLDDNSTIYSKNLNNTLKSLKDNVLYNSVEYINEVVDVIDSVKANASDLAGKASLESPQFTGSVDVSGNLHVTGSISIGDKVLTYERLSALIANL